MKLSLKEFFKKGELWSTLESTIGVIKKQLNIHYGYIKDLKNNDLTLMNHINVLKDENKDLKRKLEELERRLWELNIVSNTEGVTIVHSPDDKSLPNKALNSGAENNPRRLT